MYETTLLLKERPDSRASLKATLLAGILSLCVQMLLMTFWDNIHGLEYLRLSASVFLGNNVPTIINFPTLILGIGVHLLFSIVFGLLFITLLYNWHAPSAAFAGAIFGYLLYFLNYYGFATIFVPLQKLRLWSTCASLTLFGASVVWFYHHFSRLSSDATATPQFGKLVKL